jgi:hypothetical protein
MKSKTPLSTSTTSSTSAAKAKKPVTALAPAPATSVKTAPSPKLFTHEEISERARQVWEARGRPDGQDDSIWFEAEKELRRNELNATEESRFANKDEILDVDGDPADDIDRRLDEMASPKKDRSATSL